MRDERQPRQHSGALGIIQAVGRIRRAGYVFEWWVGDHPPRHVQVSDRNGRFLGRVALATLKPLDDWRPPTKVVGAIRQWITEGRL